MPGVSPTKPDLNRRHVHAGGQLERVDHVGAANPRADLEEHQPSGSIDRLQVEGAAFDAHGLEAAQSPVGDGGVGVGLHGTKRAALGVTQARAHVPAGLDHDELAPGKQPVNVDDRALDELLQLVLIDGYGRGAAPDRVERGGGVGKVEIPSLEGAWPAASGRCDPAMALAVRRRAGPRRAR